MGFAPPPHDGFALLASAHTDAHTLLGTPYIGSQPHAIKAWRNFRETPKGEVRSVPSPHPGQSLM